MTGSIDFAALNSATLSRCPGLLEALLPGGRVQGREYQCSDLTGGGGDSLRVNMDSGKWADFAAGDDAKGGDLVSLVAAIRGVSQLEAARELAALAGVTTLTTSTPNRQPQSSKPAAIVPVPEGVKPPDSFRHNRFGEPAATWEYRDVSGRLIGYVARFNRAEIDARGKPKKDFCPMVYTAQGWRWQGFPDPRPLYGLHRLAQAASVLITEGEGKADALQAALGANVAVLSLCGGSNAVAKHDFSPFKDRKVVYWPDADASGSKAALLVCTNAKLAGAASVAVAVPPDGVPEGWDGADAVKEGWDSGRLVAHIQGSRVTHEAFMDVATSRFGLSIAAMTRARQPELPPGLPPDPPRLQCVTAYEFLSMEFPEREVLLSPIIPRQGLCMLHAMRGIGKTFISLSVAYAVASGGKIFDRWGAPKPSRVLFLDGEMPARTLQERLAALVAGSDAEPPAADFLRILTPDMQDGPMPNIATREGQEAVEPLLSGVDLVIVDNLATLARHGRSNDEESWLPVQGWLLELRRRGMSVLMVHHQGKGGDQRGTSAKEDILDTVIRLARPKDYDPAQGARFEVHLTKARGICGADAKPFEAQLTTVDRVMTWTARDIEDAEMEHLRSLLESGSTVREAAEEMGIHKSKAQRLKKKMEGLGVRISQGTSFSSGGIR